MAPVPADILGYQQALATFIALTGAQVVAGQKTFTADLVLAGAPGKIRPAANAVHALSVTQANGTPFVQFDTTNRRVAIGGEGFPLGAMNGALSLNPRDNEFALWITLPAGAPVAPFTIRDSLGNNLMRFASNAGLLLYAPSDPGAELITLRTTSVLGLSIRGTRGSDNVTLWRLNQGLTVGGVANTVALLGASAAALGVTPGGGRYTLLSNQAGAVLGDTILAADPGPRARLDIRETTAVNSTVVDMIIAGHRVTASTTPTAGLGVAVRAEAETDNHTLAMLGRLRWNWTDPTDSSQSSGVVLSTVSEGSEVDLLVLSDAAVQFPTLADGILRAANNGVLTSGALNSNEIPWATPGDIGATTQASVFASLIRVVDVAALVQALSIAPGTYSGLYMQTQDTKTGVVLRYDGAYAQASLAGRLVVSSTDELLLVASKDVDDGGTSDIVFRAGGVLETQERLRVKSTGRTIATGSLEVLNADSALLYINTLDNTKQASILYGVGGVTAWEFFSSGTGSDGHANLGFYHEASGRLPLQLEDGGNVKLGHNPSLGYGFAYTGSNGLVHINQSVFDPGGYFYPPSFATVDRPGWDKGAVIYDSTLGKLVVGGAAGWEVVTSV